MTSVGEYTLLERTQKFYWSREETAATQEYVKPAIARKRLGLGDPRLPKREHKNNQTATHGYE